MVKRDIKLYEKIAKKFKRYGSHKSESKFIKGKKYSLFDLLKKYSNKNFKVLDLGCGSGELTLKLSPFFKEIIGIDPVKRYIKTAKKDKKTKKISNVSFKFAYGENLPFNDETFDIIYSSRGPLSSSMKFISESKRVLKKGGYLIEGTIGEKDKAEIKNVFKRGQNYHSKVPKLKKVRNLLKRAGLKLVFSKYYFYYQAYPSIDKVINLLEKSPIIPDFDKAKDKDKIKKLKEKLTISKGIILSNHRLHWVAKKFL